MTGRRGWHEGNISQINNGNFRVNLMINGKRMSYTGKTKVECSKWIRSIAVAGKSQIGSEGRTSVKLVEYFPQWLEIKSMEIEPKTKKDYEELINRYILPGLGNIYLGELSTKQIDRFYADLLQSGVGRRTIEIVHAILHCALERATKYGDIQKNPAKWAAVPKAPDPEMAVLDEDQVQRFIVTAVGNRFEILFYLAIETGMRQGELFGLKWVDIDWNRSTINVRRQIQRLKGRGAFFKEPKTKAANRIIEVGNPTIDRLRDQYQHQMELRVIAGDNWKDSDLIFSTTIGTPLDNSNVLKELYSILKDAGLPKIRFHDLRHTNASLFLNNGQDIMGISKRLGHSKPSTTLDIYGHVYSKSRHELAQTIDSLINPTRVELPEKPLVLVVNSPIVKS